MAYYADSIGRGPAASGTRQGCQQPLRAILRIVQLGLQRAGAVARDLAVLAGPRDDIDRPFEPSGPDRAELIDASCGPCRRHLASADAGTVLDATARAAYRRRLVDLRDELAEAAAYGDLGRTDRLRAEMEFLTEQLASAMGIGGAARRVGGPSERARSAVTQNIRSTLKRLVQALPVLDEPLARRIRTGAFCAYEPDPSRPVAWRL